MRADLVGLVVLVMEDQEALRLGIVLTVLESIVHYEREVLP